MYDSMFMYNDSIIFKYFSNTSIFIHVCISSIYKNMLERFSMGGTEVHSVHFALKPTPSIGARVEFLHLVRTECTPVWPIKYVIKSIIIFWTTYLQYSTSRT